MKLATLNVGGYEFHQRVIPWLCQIRADIVCLQEVMETRLDEIAAVTGLQAIFIAQAFVNSDRFGVGGPSGWGLAILARNFVSTEKLHYSGCEELIAFRDDRHARFLLTAAVKIGDEIVRVSNIHAPHGIGPATEEQLEAADLLGRRLCGGKQILCGDFNAPRGGEVMRRYTRHLQSNVPAGCTTTIDGDLHRSGHLGIVCDDILSGTEIDVRNVNVHYGISDHAGITATIGHRVERDRSLASHGFAH